MKQERKILRSETIVRQVSMSGVSFVFIECPAQHPPSRGVGEKATSFFGSIANTAKKEIDARGPGQRLTKGNVLDILLLFGYFTI
jgi:hypothetical protein